MKKIKYLINRASQQLGIPFYTRSQQYEVSYEVALINLLSSSNNVELVMPVFPATKNQDIIRGNAFAPEPSKILIDKKFKNSYASYSFSLAAHENVKISEKAVLKVVPVKDCLNLKQKISNYDKNSKKYQTYIQPDAFLNSNISEISKIANALGIKDFGVIAVARKLYNYVVSRLDYGNQQIPLCSAKEAISANKCDCGGFSSLLGALLKYFGIPCRIVSGFWAGKPENDMHVWLEFLMPDNSWISVDAATGMLAPKYRTKKMGGFGLLGSDRIITSVGQDIKLEMGSRKVSTDILQCPIVSAQGGQKSVSINFQLKTT